MAQTTNGKSAPPVLTNAEIAALLDETAGLLEAQEANPYRVQAYRNGAQTLRNLARPAADLLESEGIEGLERLPAIGRSLARAIEQIVDTGRLTLLERLRGQRVGVIVCGTNIDIDSYARAVSAAEPVIA